MLLLPKISSTAVTKKTLQNQGPYLFFSFFLCIIVGYLTVGQHTNMRTHQFYSYFCVNLEIRHPIVHSYIVYIIF